MFKTGAARFCVRGDSVTALRLVTKLASPSARMNAIGAEIALELEALQIEEVFAQHSPGKLLVIADWLSRIYSPDGRSEVPEELKTSKRKEVPVRDSSFYKVWSIAS